MHGVTKDESATDCEYYTDHEIAALLDISLGRLRNKLCSGNPLPPRIQPPGCRNRLWPRNAVHAWLEQFIVTVAEPVVDPEPRRRGRPTKHEERLQRR